MNFIFSGKGNEKQVKSESKDTTNDCLREIFKFRVEAIIDRRDKRSVLVGSTDWSHPRLQWTDLMSELRTFCLSRTTHDFEYYYTIVLYIEIHSLLSYIAKKFAIIVPKGQPLKNLFRDQRCQVF